MRDLEYLDPEKCRIIRAARKEQGLSQKDLAKLIYVSPSGLSRIARGLAPCSTEHRRALEDALKLKPNSLSPTCPSRRCNGLVFSFPLPRKKPDIIVGPEVDDLLATLPPEMQQDAARLVLEVVSGICRVMASTRQASGRKV
jgi:transcriptional regulator with XRE-family HTH domain